MGIMGGNEKKNYIWHACRSKPFVFLKSISFFEMPTSVHNLLHFESVPANTLERVAEALMQLQCPFVILHIYSCMMGVNLDLLHIFVNSK